MSSTISPTIHLRWIGSGCRIGHHVVVHADTVVGDTVRIDDPDRTAVDFSHIRNVQQSGGTIAYSCVEPAAGGVMRCTVRWLRKPGLKQLTEMKRM